MKSLRPYTAAGSDNGTVHLFTLCPDRLTHAGLCSVPPPLNLTSFLERLPPFPHIPFPPKGPGFLPGVSPVLTFHFLICVCPACPEFHRFFFPCISRYNCGPADKTQGIFLLFWHHYGHVQYSTVQFQLFLQMWFFYLLVMMIVPPVPEDLNFS